MSLKNLEIAGFKSFANKSVFDFKTSITGVVGPNGSGKSNVVEAIRFVLGEQSMKSLRGKLGADLIFKGSKNISTLGKASVTITFDNTRRVFRFESATGTEINLDYDEIKISRAVYKDGSSEYFLNGSQVRLKDIVELLSSVNIGASGHHIISQGEADRILSSSQKDRRAMIEDALGLKIYQYRLRESERKLQRATDNLKEATSLRRELAPHLNFLKKQVEKVERAREMREELRGLYKEYLSSESADLSVLSAKLSGEEREVNAEIKNIETEIAKLPENEFDAGEQHKEVGILSNSLFEIRNAKNELLRKLGRIEGMIEVSKSAPSGNAEHSSAELSAVVHEIEVLADNTVESDIESIKGAFLSIKRILSEFRKGKTEKIEVTDNSEWEIAREEIQKEISGIEQKEKELEEKIGTIKSAIEKAKEDFSRANQSRFEWNIKRTEAQSRRNMIASSISNLSFRKNEFETALKEATELLNVLAEDIAGGVALDASARADLKHKIERIKIKLEDFGLGGADELMKEYQETAERERFLEREIGDLDESVKTLQSIMKELQEKIETEFKSGVLKINRHFGEFFSLMFGGGSASITTMVIEKRKTEAEEAVQEIKMPDVEDDDAAEVGIDISVNLPKKKVRDLAMLSGGERSLVSIALLFAISQVNPPPFLVLDETDAALDEANSKKYGDMLENLAKNSVLVVVTHNRETMSRAGVLYGVTIGSDGASRLLSVKLDEAVQIAK